jgi:hypothetical protein
MFAFHARARGFVVRYLSAAIQRFYIMALRRSPRRLAEPARPAPGLQSATDDALDGFETEPEAEDDDTALADLNNPDVAHLGNGPSVGGARSRATSDLFGEEAEHASGRASSPRLYAQAAQFPTCVQLRVWKWENGVPVGLGSIDAEASEDEFVRRFFTAMPRRGEGRAQFKLRPIDIRGQELGQEVTIVISEHHAAMRAIREADEEEREIRSAPPQAPANNEFSGEMSRMVEHMLATAEQRSRALEEALEMERDRMRDEELRRTQERVDLASQAAQGVHAITERMMKDEAGRAERALRAQSDQSQVLVTTLTSIFSQQQMMAQQQSEASRRADEYRLEQERQRAERERVEADTRLRREREEADHKRQREREEAEMRLRLEREEAARKYDQAKLEIDAKLKAEREELERRERREREDAERRERWLSEERARRETREGQEAREREAERSRQHDRMLKELEVQAQRDREHAERMIQMSKMELESKSNAQSSDVLGSAAKMLAQFGIEPSEILPRILGMKQGDDDEDEKPSPWAAALPSVIGVIGDIARAAAQSKSAQAAQQEAEARRATAMLPPPPPQRALPPPGMMYGPPAAQQGAEPVAVPQQASGAPAAPAAAPTTPAQEVARSLSEVASEKGLQLKAQKAARVALRNLVRDLGNTTEEKWEQLIALAIQNELAIYHYVRAVSVKSALREAGASEDLANKIIESMRKSPLVPTDMPYEVSE